MKTQAGAWGAGVRCAVTAGEHPSSPFHLYYRFQIFHRNSLGARTAAIASHCFQDFKFQKQIVKKKKKIQFLIWVSYRDPIAHTRRLHGLQMVASPLGSSSVGVCFQYSKGSTSSIINTSKSDLTIKINIQKNLSVHTSERISNTFTQKNNIIKDLFT